ncbi:MAG: 4'-phosphopantetheinyl transferase superfamily protein [Burkholderiales bacterium]
MARRAWVAFARIDDVGERALAQVRRGLQGRERRRYARFPSARRAREFLAGRWLAAASRRAWHGKGPSVTSISHSGGWVACALAERGWPGVDIEPMVKRDFATLGAWAFPDDWIEGADAPRAFYGRWTRYEARLKSGSDRAHAERTWFIDGVALSVRMPPSLLIGVGAPRRWRRSAFVRASAD